MQKTFTKVLFTFYGLIIMYIVMTFALTDAGECLIDGEPCPAECPKVNDHTGKVYEC